LLGCKGPAHTNQSGAAKAFFHYSEHPKQDIDPLPGNGASDVQQIDVALIGRSQQTRNLEFGCEIGLARARRVRSEWHDSQTVSRNQVMGKQSIPGRSTGAHDKGCHPKSSKCPANHSPERGGADIVLGFDKASECIDVMARHQRSAGRQFQDQLRITVVDNMENIGSVAISAQKSWIVPKPVQNAVKIKREAG